MAHNQTSAKNYRIQGHPTWTIKTSERRYFHVNFSILTSNAYFHEVLLSKVPKTIPYSLTWFDIISFFR